MAVSIAALEQELIGLVTAVPAFAATGFSVFDIADFLAKAGPQTLPVYAVAYDGLAVVGNEATPTNNKSSAVTMIAAQFVVVVAMQYNYTGQDDTKQQAFTLMDQIREAVLGFQGSNTRPWRFIAEQPEPEASGDGMIVYSQVWQTTLPIVGNFNRT